jgi:hypothetical protein
MWRRMWTWRRARGGSGSRALCAVSCADAGFLLYVVRRRRGSKRRCLLRAQEDAAGVGTLRPHAEHSAASTSAPTDGVACEVLSRGRVLVSSHRACRAVRVLGVLRVLGVRAESLAAAEFEAVSRPRGNVASRQGNCSWRGSTGRHSGRATKGDGGRRVCARDNDEVARRRRAIEYVLDFLHLLFLFHCSVSSIFRSFVSFTCRC